MEERIEIRTDTEFKQLLSAVAEKLSINLDEIKDLGDEFLKQIDLKKGKVTISEIIRANLSLCSIIENAIYDSRNDLSTVFAIYKAILDYHANRLTIEQKADIFLGNYIQWKSDKNIELDNENLRNAVYTVLYDSNINIEISENKIEFKERRK